MVLIVTTPFAAMAKHWAARLAFPALPTIVLDHPIGHLPAADLERRGESIVDTVIAGLTTGASS